MIGTLSGIAIIAAGGVLALLYRHWAKVDAECRKRMSERQSKKLGSKKPPKAQGVGTSSTRGKSGATPTFGRR